jgi:hypothetical protein
MLREVMAPQEVVELAQEVRLPGPCPLVLHQYMY